jgi:hypothetical protein
VDGFLHRGGALVSSVICVGADVGLEETRES